LSRIEERTFGETGLVEIIIPGSVEVMDENCFGQCRSLSSITVESGSRLSRIRAQAFIETGLIEVIIPALVDLLSVRCLLNANHFPLLQLNQGRDCQEIERMH
jgi:ABC-type phosphate transport system permease subunit